MARQPPGDGPVRDCHHAIPRWALKAFLLVQNSFATTSHMFCRSMRPFFKASTAVPSTLRVRRRCFALRDGQGISA